MSHVRHRFAIVLAIASAFGAQAAQAVPPTISALSIDTATGNVIITGNCTATVSGAPQVKVIFVDSSSVNHVVKKVHCPSSGSGTTKVKPPFVDLVTMTALPSGSYTVCLKQLSTTGCWGTPITI